jgi:hypothetical protein
MAFLAELGRGEVHVPEWSGRPLAFLRLRFGYGEGTGVNRSSHESRFRHVGLHNVEIVDSALFVNRNDMNCIFAQLVTVDERP